MPSKKQVEFTRKLRRALAWIKSSSYLNRDALPFKTHLFVAPLGLFAGIRFDDTPTQPEVAIDVLIGLISFSSMIFFLWIIWLAFYRRDKNGRRLNIFLIIIGLVAGGTRGALTEILAASFFQTTIDFDALFQRFCTSGVAWAFAVPVFAHVTSGIREFTKVRDKALYTLLLQERERKSFLKKASQAPSGFQAEVTNLLANTFQPLRSSILANKDLPRAAQLDEIIDKILRGTSFRVREISHEIADSGIRMTGKVSAARLIRESLFYNQINLPATMLVVLLANFVSPLFKAGFLAAFSQAAVGGAVAIGILFAIRMVSIESKAAAINVFLASLTYAAIHSWLQLNIYQQQVSDQLQQTFWSLFTLNFLVLFLALVISGLQKSSKLAGDELMKKLEASIDRSRLETHLLEELSRQDALALSEYLHGYLQSQLMAISIQLRVARKSGNESQIDQLLSHVQVLADNPLSKFEPGIKSNLEDGIRILAVTWAGILTLEYVATGDVSALPVLDQVLALQVIEEAISNAYRHGEATRATVRVSTNENGEIKVEVSDNGLGIHAAKPGLGSENFERISAGHWSLDNNQSGSGATLTLQILRITS